MKVIGIAGGIASGKSRVTQFLAERGAYVLDADRIGHEVLRRPDVRAEIRERWGDLVFNGDGNVDRAALAQIVFAAPPQGPRDLAILEQITHPRIQDAIHEQLAGLRRQGVPAVVLDAPVMFKAGWDRDCDVVLFVETPEHRRRQWARDRGWTEEQLAARERAQLPIAEKRARSSAFLRNDGGLQELEQQVEAFWQATVERTE